jgi:simple sugar transport system substrate-binding protein
MCLPPNPNHAVLERPSNEFRLPIRARRWLYLPEEAFAETLSPLAINPNPRKQIRLMQRFRLCRSLGGLVLGLLLASGLNIAAAKEYQFAVIPKLRAAWFNRLEAGTKKAAQDFGVQTYMQAPATADEAEQARLIQDAISRGVDAILVVPNNAQSLEPVFAQAKQAGIVVVTHESPNQQNTDFDIEMINNEKFGQAAMELLAQGLGGKGDFVVYVGSLTVPAHNLWADAALKLAKEKYPDLKVVADRFPVSEDQNAAREKSLELLRTYPNLRGFLAFGSQGGPGAAQAIREQHVPGAVVVGTTSPNQAGQYLDDGTMTKSILWDPGEGGYAMVWLAKQVLDKKSVTEGTEIPTIGKIPSLKGNTITYDLPLILDKSNRKNYDF